MFIVNIGLVASCDYTCGDLSSHQVEVIAKEHGFTVVQSEIAQSISEPTLVGLLVDDVLDGTSRARLYRLSAALHQDCIAVIPAFKRESATKAMLALRNGRLIGPNAARWGDFNASLFILPSFEWEYRDDAPAGRKSSPAARAAFTNAMERDLIPVRRKA